MFVSFLISNEKRLLVLLFVCACVRVCCEKSNKSKALREERKRARRKTRPKKKKRPAFESHYGWCNQRVLYASHINICVCLCICKNQSCRLFVILHALWTKPTTTTTTAPAATSNWLTALYYLRCTFRLKWFFPFEWHLIQSRATNFIFNLIIKFYLRKHLALTSKTRRPIRTCTHALCVKLHICWKWLMNNHNLCWFVCHRRYNIKAQRKKLRYDFVFVCLFVC